jgi:transposase-like protein
MILTCNRCKTVTRVAPAGTNQQGYLCQHCAQTPDLPLFNQAKGRKPGPKPKRKRHPAEGGPDPAESK